MKYFSVAALETVIAPWWKIRLAMIFGRKTVLQEDGNIVTIYTWRGVHYLTGYAPTTKPRG